MQVQVQDRNGNYYMVKKRVRFDLQKKMTTIRVNTKETYRYSAIDPSLPTYVKIPGRPIPRSWAHSILRLPLDNKLEIPPGSR